MIALNVGCSAVMNWIQLNKDLLGRFPPTRPHLIGVSGGRDSIALLDRLVDLGYEKLIVCHLNHQLRGRSSDADARFVRALASKYGLQLELEAVNIRALAAGKLDRINRSSFKTRPETWKAGKRMSIESAGRDARYLFFARVAKRKKCYTIFLAHHADDLVETFLLNLLRGAGTTGLAAMREVSRRRIENVDLTIVRPLLAV